MKMQAAGQGASVRVASRRVAAVAPLRARRSAVVVRARYGRFVAKPSRAPALLSEASAPKTRPSSSLLSLSARENGPYLLPPRAPRCPDRLPPGRAFFGWQLRSRVLGVGARPLSTSERQKREGKRGGGKGGEGRRRPAAAGPRPSPLSLSSTREAAPPWPRRLLPLDQEGVLPEDMTATRLRACPRARGPRMQSANPTG